MKAQIVFFTFFLLIAGSLAEVNPIDFVYEVSRFIRQDRIIYGADVNLLNFAEGFLNGVGSAPLFDQIKSCIADTGSFASDVLNGVEDIKTKDPSKVKEGIYLLGQAAELVPTAAQTCKAAVSDVEALEKFIQTFQSPTSFLYYIGKSLLINHVEVINEITNAVTAYEAQDYTQLGYWVGKAMDTIIIGQSFVNDAKTDVLDFAEGFLTGVGSAPLFDQIKACISDAGNFATDVVSGIEDIKTKNAAQVKQGIYLLGEAAEIIPTAAQTCKAAASDIQTLEKFIQAFKNPASFLYYIGKSLLINHVEVINEVTSAVSAYDSQNYNQLGYWVGKAMDTIIIGQTGVSDVSADVVNFAEGFLSGVGSAALFDQIKGCLSDAGTFASDILNGVEDIKTKDPSKVKQGIYLLGEAAELVPAAAQLCKAAGSDVASLEKFIKTFQSPTSFLYYIGKSLLINHVEVINEVTNAVSAYDSQNYNQLGYWVGKAMDTVILGQSFINTIVIKDTKTDILEFAQGFFQGVGNAAAFDQVKACITDSEDTITDLTTAVKDIETKDAAEVEAGIKLIGQAVQIIPDAVQECKAGAVDLKSLVKMVESFKSPVSFLYYIGKSLLINHVDVTKEIGNVVSNWQQQNYQQVGYWVGQAMDTVFLGEDQALVQDTKTDILEFVQGFFQGVGNAAAFDQVKACITDSEDTITDLTTAVKDIETKDAAEVEAGIKLIGQAVQIIPDAVQECKAGAVDLKSLVKMVESFKSPVSFLYYIGKSLLINHVDVMKEIENVVSNWQQQNYQQVGYWVGQAMDTVFLGEDQTLIKDTKTDILNFVEGFFQGIGSASAFDQVKACITDSEDVITDLTTAVKDIETKDPAQVEAGVKLIGQAVQIVPDAVQLCQAGAVDLKTLIKMVNAFKNPASFLYYIGKSLLINHVEVYKEVSNAVTGYDQGNYEQTGYWVGKAMDTVVLGEDQTLNQDLADHLNQVSGWKAAIPSKFEGMTYAEIKSRFLGAKKVDLSQYDNLTEYNYEGVTDIPSYFNASQQWPDCIHAIRDQGQCGSCWAFAASEVLSDRLCIASNGSVNVVLSPQYLISCNDVLNHGCNGGNLLFSWWFMDSDGMVTDSCLPYESYNGTNPLKCKDFTTCADGTPLKKYYAKGAVSLSNPASIQANLIQYGPVEAGMTVYQDFMYYQGGIYKHTSGSELGGHAVKITGWGNENGENYWIVANSWGPSWGENGFFRIAWGQCGIDSGCVAGQADLSKTMTSENRFW